MIRDTDFSSPPLLGLRPDNPVPGSFTKLINAIPRRGKLYQREPRHSMDNGQSASYPKSIHEMITDIGKYVVVDIPLPFISKLKVLVATSTQDGREINLSSYYQLISDFDDDPSLIPSYEAGREGLFRTDGINQNIIILDYNDWGGVGLDPPDGAPGVTLGVADEGEVDPPPAPNLTIAMKQKASSDMEVGTHRVFASFVGIKDSVSYEGIKSATLSVVLSNANQAIWSMFGWAYGNFVFQIYDDMKARIYKAPVDSDGPFYLVEEITVPQLPYTIDVDEATLVSGTQYVDLEGISSDVHEYEFRYIYVKEYPSGSRVYSNPSPATFLETARSDIFNITYTPSIDSEVTHIWIYRTLWQAPGVLFRAIVISNSGGSVVIDRTDEEIAADDYVLEFDNGRPPKSRFCAKVKDQMIYAHLVDEPNGGSMFAISKTSEHEHVPANRWVNFATTTGDDITGLIEIAGYLLVFKKNSSRKYIPNFPYPQSGASETTGLIDIRTLKPVGKNLICGLGMSGVWLFDAQQFVLISEFKIQETYIQGFIDADAIFHSAYYPEVNQYHLLMYTIEFGDITQIGEHRHFVCDIESGEWAELSFTDESGDYIFDVCLGHATDENARQVIVSASIVDKNGSVIYMYENGIIPDPAASSVDIITEEATQSAWASAINLLNKDCYFLGRDNGDHKLFSMAWSGSFAEAVDRGAPSGMWSLLKLYISGGKVFVVTLDDNGDCKFSYYAISTSSWSSLYSPDIAASGIYVESDKIAIIPNYLGDIFYTFLHYNDNYDEYSEATELALEYSEGDVVWQDNRFARIKKYLGYTSYSTGTNPSNGNIFNWAWRYPEIIDLPDLYAQYFYDQTGTLSDEDEIKFAGIPAEISSISFFNNESTYTVSFITTRIFKVLYNGNEIAFPKRYYSHLGVQGDYAWKNYVDLYNIKWLPIATTWEYETYIGYTHSWEELNPRGYTRPYIGVWDGVSMDYFLNDFLFGDGLYKKSFTGVYAGGENWMYFLQYVSDKSQYWISRISILGDTTDAIERIFEWFPGNDAEGNESGLPDEIRLFVSDDFETIYIYNGLNIRRHEANLGWSYSKISNDLNVTDILYNGNLDCFWMVGEENEIGVIDLLAGDFSIYRIEDAGEILPAGLKGSSVVPDENWFVACHEDGDGGGSTIYSVHAQSAINEIQEKAILKNYKQKPALYGVIVEMQSAFTDLNQQHFVKRGKNVWITIESERSAVGIFAIGAEINVGRKERFPVGSISITEPWAIVYCLGKPNWADDIFDHNLEPQRINECELYLEGTTAKIRWNLKAGDMLPDNHSSLIIYPPSFKVQVVRDKQDDK